MSVGVLGCDEIVPRDSFRPVGAAARNVVLVTEALAAAQKPVKRNAQQQLQTEMKAAITRIESGFTNRGVTLVDTFKAGAIVPQLIDALQRKKEQLLKKCVIDGLARYPLKAALIDAEISGITGQSTACQKGMTTLLGKLKADGTVNRPYNKPQAAL